MLQVMWIVDQAAEVDVVRAVQMLENLQTAESFPPCCGG